MATTLTHRLSGSRGQTYKATYPGLAAVSKITNELEPMDSDIREIISTHDTASEWLRHFQPAQKYRDTVLALSYDVALVFPAMSEKETGSLTQLSDALRTARQSLLSRRRSLADLSPHPAANLSQAVELLSRTGCEDLQDVRKKIYSFYDNVRYDALGQYQDISYVLRHDFFACPFHVAITEIRGFLLDVDQELRTVKLDDAWMNKYTIAFQEVGRMWADRNLHKSTVANIGKLQATLLQGIENLIKEEVPTFRWSASEASDKSAVHVHLFELLQSIQKEVTREKDQKFSIAFCGMVKAGKSLFINALIGYLVLPSDELPSTALPCRLQHVKGQSRPTLEIDASYFRRAITRLKKHRYGSMMQGYTPDEDPFSSAFGSDSDDDDQFEQWPEIAVPTRSREEDVTQKQIYNKWVDLHPTTKDNLLLFEQESFVLASHASGAQEVSKLLAQINDIMRLCHRLEVGLPEQRHPSWPVLKVEFNALRGRDITGDIEFIDLPGIGEASGSGDFHAYEDMVRLVAKEANALVPIVSFKEIAKDDWRSQLPVIIKNGLGRAPEVVLCTHLDQVPTDRQQQQIASVAKAFWPKSGDAVRRVLCCSTRLGIGARALVEQSRRAKPEFNDFWKENDLKYDCAERILGVGNAEQKFKEMNLDEWKQAVDERLKESRLEEAIQRLTMDIVARERGLTLMMEGQKLRGMVNKSFFDQQRLLLGISRTTEEYEKAYSAFKKTKEQITNVLSSWQADERHLHKSSSDKLDKAFKILQKQCLDLGPQAMTATLKHIEWQRKVKQLEDANKLKFYRKAEAEFFLLAIQEEMHASLATIKRQFVQFVRDLADKSRAERFDSLKNKIQRSIKDDSQNDLKGSVLDKLEVYGQDIDTLVLSKLGKKVLRTVIASRHNAASAYNAIQVAIAKPLLNATSRGVEPDEGSVDSGSMEAMSITSTTAHTDIEQLGFMLRAPVAVLATIPWLLSSGVWPFMARSKHYVLDKDAVLQEIETRAMRPYVDGLRQESVDTLRKIELTSSVVARKAVEDALDEEEEQFAREQQTRKRMEQSVEELRLKATASMTLLLNLCCAEAGLDQLQRHLKDLNLPTT